MLYTSLFIDNVGDEDGGAAVHDINNVIIMLIIILIITIFATYKL